MRVDQIGDPEAGWDGGGLQGYDDDHADPGEEAVPVVCVEAFLGGPAEAQSDYGDEGS